ncbi:hypothetical protein [Actinoallomurus soli]|uniref:hypothetical protein n=1 Tax=Actinoallomurus soli TaxID=2952535 RepID=UPI002093CA8F|nr:hypothetical protein [Actinoallomurus soli]MCO5969247.1 hypothetical protein [Actinoallomurus soli]
MTGIRTWKRVAVGLGALAVCGPVGAGLYTRVSYGEWSPFTPPDRLRFCGVRYYRAGAPGEEVTTSRAGAMRADRATRWLRATSVGLARWQVYRTSVWSCPEPDGRNGDGHTLYVKIGADRYLEMDDDN